MSEAETVLARDINRDDLVARLRALRPLFEREGVTHMTLFGSRARGDNRPDSDVDVLIEVNPEVKFSLVELSGVGLIVQDEVGFPASVVMRRSARPAMLSAARRDGIVVF